MLTILKIQCPLRLLLNLFSCLCKDFSHLQIFQFGGTFRIVFVNIFLVFKLVNWSFLLTSCLCLSLLYYFHFMCNYISWCRLIISFIFTLILSVSTWFLLSVCGTCVISFHIVWICCFGSTWCDARSTIIALFAVSMMCLWCLPGIVPSSHSFLHSYWSFSHGFFPLGIGDKKCTLEQNYHCILTFDSLILSFACSHSSNTSSLFRGVNVGSFPFVTLII